MSKQWPQKTKDEAVAMYEAGKTYKAITAETGVPMATMIYWLHERGIQPSRLNKSNGQVSVDQLLQRLAASEREVGRLQTENRRLLALLIAAENGE